MIALTPVTSDQTILPNQQYLARLGTDYVVVQLQQEIPLPYKTARFQDPIMGTVWRASDLDELAMIT